MVLMEDGGANFLEGFQPREVRQGNFFQSLCHLKGLLSSAVLKMNHFKGIGKIFDIPI
jgi:hypothetical protein